MRHLFFIIATILGLLSAVARSWTSDRYLAGYEETTVTMPEDYDGDVVCTVVRKESDCDDKRIGVLYIHGFNDYFFQSEMGDRFVDSCYSFYAVDLRKYGRSLRDGQRPYQARNINEYYADIDSTLTIMHNDGIKRVVLMGHSTGGLIVASYLNVKPDTAIRAVILNSPFLEWNMGGFMKKVAIPTVSFLGRLFPNLSISQGDGTAYAESLLEDYHGEWSYDTDLKTIHPRNVTAGWIRAISRAQKALRKHSAIACPVLLLHSNRSVDGAKWTPEHNTGDAVLNVEDIARIGKELGPDVSEVTIDGGLHDLVLSTPAVRTVVYDVIFAWLRENMAR